MRAAAAVAVAAVAAAGGAARAQDWTTAAYDAQRSSWVRAPGKISAASLRKPGFELLWKLGLADEASTARGLTAPVLLDLLIGYRGFRALGFVGAPPDRVMAIDTDLGRVEWERRVAADTPPARGSPACARAMTPNLARPTNPALPALIGGPSRAAQPARGAVGDSGEGAVTLAQLAARRREAPRPAPAAPPYAAQRPAPRPFPVVYVLSSDGLLHTLNVMNGADAESPVPFLPPYADARGLIVVNDVAYVATNRGCGNVPEGVWALDLGTKQVVTWRASGGIAGALGPAIAPDGTIYVTTGDGRLIALEPRTLKPKRMYRSGGPGFASSFVLFDHGGKLLVAASSRDGRIRLFDGGRTAFIRTPVFAHALADELTTWADTNDTRWLVAPARSLVPREPPAAYDAVVAWKVVRQDSVTILQPGWVSSETPAPIAAAVVNDVVFVVSAGHKPRSPAVLYALDGATGQALWSSGATIPTSGRAGLSAGGSEVYVATAGDTLYAFGFPMEH